ncbi:hypothetical protein ILYODFUR_013637 [Ilyodon furcidens]|uniref:Secreted protein n=1 Tax=Ilyodon furcidens TaxID=33524 RepID=A0ABV0SY24_9TELE
MPPSTGGAAALCAASRPVLRAAAAVGRCESAGRAHTQTSAATSSSYPLNTLLSCTHFQAHSQRRRAPYERLGHKRKFGGICTTKCLSCHSDAHP